MDVYRRHDRRDRGRFDARRDGGLAAQGKTTVSANLAASFAQAGQEVLLIDADLRRARQHQALEVEQSPGLAELLRGEAALEQAIRRPDGFPFDLVPSGELPGNPAELLGSERFDLVLSEAATTYDLVVVDSPVLLGVSDALLIASRVDGTLLVHKPGSVEGSAFLQIREDLERVGAHLMGFVINQVEARDRHLYPGYLESPYLQVRKRKRFRLARGERDRRKPQSG